MPEEQRPETLAEGQQRPEEQRSEAVAEELQRPEVGRLACGAFFCEPLGLLLQNPQRGGERPHLGMKV